MTTTTANARVEYHPTRRFPWLPVCDCGTTFAGYVREHAAQTMADAHECPEVLTLPLRAAHNGLRVSSRSWAEGVGAQLAAAIDADPALDASEWLAARPAESVVLTGDALHVDRTAWCAGRCGDPEPVQYEAWTAAGRTAHGWACRVCRKVTQTG